MKTELAVRRADLPAVALRTVLVFRALNLGDMLCAVPALRALRAGIPGARISLAGLPWARSFAARFSRYIDAFVEFPGYPGLPERTCDPAALRNFLQSVRTQQFDLAVQMHGSGTVSNAFVGSLGARIRSGFYPAGQECPDPGWFLPYPENESEVERNMSLMRHLGFAGTGTELEFPVTEEDARELSHWEELADIRPGRYVCIHPGASSADKRWPIENFGTIGRFVRQRGYTVVITGNRKESVLAHTLSRIMAGECRDAASIDLGLGSLALLIRASRLLVCNDTGVSHLAAALRVPSVVIFTKADPLRWAPLDRDLHRSIGGQGQRPSVQDVLRAVKELLG